jgi:FAD:protein FMN transferase
VPGRRIAALLVLILTQACGPAEDPAPRRWEFETMGTQAALEIRGPLSEHEAEGHCRVLEAFSTVDSLMSTWDPNSELSRLNRAPADSSLELSPLLGDCLARALALRTLSGGAFEPGAEPLMRLWGFYRREGRLPEPETIAELLPRLDDYDYEPDTRRFVKRREETAIDLGGIAKGFALDLAAAALMELKLTRAMIDLGGNLYCLGEADAGRSWRVGIRDPLDRDRLFASIALQDRAVATSGSYERFVTIDGKRYGHIMNPATGRPAEGLLSATVISEDATLGDGLATALFVLGPAQAESLLARLPGIEAVLVLPAPENEKTRVRATRALQGDLEISPEYLDRFHLGFF